MPLYKGRVNSIKITERSSKTLTKEQKRFNRLVKEIESLRAEIADVRAADLELTEIGTTRVLPIEETLIQLERTWVMALHTHPARANFTQRLREKFAKMMCEQIGGLLDTRVFAGDAKLKAVYDGYATASDNERVRTIEHGETSDLEADENDFGDRARFDAETHIKHDDWEAEEAARAEKRTQQKKAAKQAQALAKRKVVAAAVGKTTRQIYLQLIKFFHPDRERDEAKRLEKTEVMKQITLRMRPGTIFGWWNCR